MQKQESQSIASRTVEELELQVEKVLLHVLMIVAGQVQASIQEKETYRKELILAKEKVKIV